MYPRRTLSNGFKCFSLAFVVVLSSTAVATCQNYSSDVQWLIDVLELERSSVVADIGAGDGDQTREIAQYIGQSGKVYSTELGENSLQELRESVGSLENVTVVEGHPTQTNLPEECCDAIYLRRVYHHFDDPTAMNQSLLATLKPGGRLAVIDFEPRGSESEDPEGRESGSQHGVTNETVVNELKKAGFNIISSDQRSGRDIYVVAEKPKNR